MVEVESAQEILCRFAAARMLGGDHAGHDFENLTATHEGPFGNLLEIRVTLGGCLRLTEQVFGLAGDDERVERVYLMRKGFSNQA